ncbi:glycosyltransferase [uncultured Desulfovibrio sp.]|uniref:glycosyltransferase n=1 Tax=uncultured Desulfovibrio sp. TaxID=167968 RepID=UPI0026DCC4AA|nr:glycosyltransferase [uncultured Desulfovibrio sp.]
MTNSLISVICVCDDCHDGLESRLTGLMDEVARLARFYEVLIIDNAGRDGSADTVKRVMRKRKGIRLISLAEAQPLDVVFRVGLEHCIGDYALLLDLRDLYLPALAPLLRACTDEGYDIARLKRSVGEPLLHRWASAAFYRCIRVLTGQDIDGGLSSAGCMNRNVINALINNKDRITFLKYRESQAGHRQKTVFCDAPAPRPRCLLWRIGSGVERIIATSDALLHACAGLSLTVSLVNFLYIVFSLGSWLFEESVVKGWTSLSLTTSFMFMTLFLILAVMCEYLSVIFKETKKSPLYYIAEDVDSSCLFEGMDDTKNIVQS